MFEKYKELFRVYLDLCKERYNPEKPYDNLEECVEWCRDRSHELEGMLVLLKEVGEIGEETFALEQKRVIREFSSIHICNAYMEKGEVVVFAPISD